MAARKKKTRKAAGKKRRSTRAAAGRGPGRRLAPAEEQRRLDALKRHGSKTSPEPLTAQRIADKLGINVGTWNVWKSNQRKRSGAGPAARGRPRKAASSLEAVIAGFRDIERERDQLRRVIERVQKALAEAP